MTLSQKLLIFRALLYLVDMGVRPTKEQIVADLVKEIKYLENINQ